MTEKTPESGESAENPLSQVTTGVEVGTRINNNYEIEQIISAGGMGEVYRGVNYHTGDPVAIKIVLPALAHDEKILTLFRREARILSKLAHDNIVRYYNFIKDPDLERFCLIMEFVDGIPLSDHIKKNGPMSLPEVKILLSALASGLDKAHNAEVTHRDLSPDNVILEGDRIEHAKIIDFGIAKSSSITEGTLHGQFAGKFNFVSPEQLGHFEGKVDARSDIYSLALLAAAACRGTPLKMGSSIVEAVNTRRAVPELEGIYEELHPLLTYMLQPDPANRPQSMGEVVTLLGAPGTVPSAPAPVQDDDKTVVAVPLPTADELAGSGSTQRPETQQESIDELFDLPTAPGNAPPAAAPATPASAEKKGKGGMIALVLILLLGIGGGGAYFAGLLDLGEDLNGTAETETDSDDTETADSGSDDDQDEDAESATTASNETEAEEETSEPEETASSTETDAEEEAEETASASEQTEESTTSEETTSNSSSDSETPSTESTTQEEETSEPESTQTAMKEAEDVEPEETQSEPETSEPEETTQETTETLLDTVARYQNWIADYETGECSYKVVRNASQDKIELEAFGKTVAPFEALMSDFQSAQGIEPDIGFRPILDTQCPVLGFMNTLAEAKRPAPLLTLDKDVLHSGEGIQGTVTGMDGRAVWLFLISGQGGVYNLTTRLKLDTDGVGRFKFNMRLSENSDPTPQLIVAMTSRRPLITAKAAKNGTMVEGLLPMVETEIDTTPDMEPAASIRYFRLDN